MSRLPDFEAWAVFAKVAETGSFAHAAVELGLSKATVSKSVVRLERRLGASLLNRTSRRLSLTAAGTACVTDATRLLADTEAAEAAALSQSRAPEGLVRVTAPMSFGLAHVAPLLPELLLAHPGLRIDLHLSDEQVDLIGGGFDLGLRIAALAPSSLKARRLCDIQRVLVGSSTYFERSGRPTHPEELANHRCLGYAYLPDPDRWRFVDIGGNEVTVRPGGPLRTNNADALMPALLAGLGVAVQPAFSVWQDIIAGRLEHVMAGWSMPPIGLHVVSPPGGPRPARISATIDFLVDRLGSAPWAIGISSATDG